MNDRKEDEDLFCETNQAQLREIDAKARALGLGWQLTAEKESNDQQREYRIQLLQSGGRVFWKVNGRSIAYVVTATKLRLEACLETHQGQTKKPRDHSKGINVMTGPVTPADKPEVVLAHLDRPNSNGVCFTVRDRERMVEMLNKRPRLVQLSEKSPDDVVTSMGEPENMSLVCGKIEDFRIDEHNRVVGKLSALGPKADRLMLGLSPRTFEFSIRTNASGEGNPRVLHDITFLSLSVVNPNNKEAPNGESS